ncbi:MAG: hypothetical protein ACTHL1_09465, partial [Burkholderiaceae bacterium]
MLASSASPCPSRAVSSPFLGLPASAWSAVLCDGSSRYDEKRNGQSARGADIFSLRQCAPTQSANPAQAHRSLVVKESG